ncbi:MAG: Tad domain-containing protein, partial [Gemmatimonadetes bacterium]|nr:Tad domain-containing protein [Gemmatimonadota bacterium]
MNRASHAPSGASSNRGQALVVVAVMMASLLGIGALAVDLGYLYVTRNELQDVADGAALAGARMLGHIYQGLAPEAQVGFVCGSGCVNSIKGTTQDVASHNVAGGVIMSVDTMNDVAIGHWDGDTFTPTLNQPDAVQVITRREPGTNGQVGTFFARTLGIFTASVNAVAVAALTGQGTTNPGEIELPIGISSFFFENPDYCHDDITFYPTNDP